MTNWILCPLRNGLYLTKQAAKTFAAQDIGNVDVLFINNGSTDGTAEWLSSVDAARISCGNLSVAQSWNIGLRFLFGFKGAQYIDYVLVVNNDVELRPDTYRHLVEDGGFFVTGVGVDDRKAIEPGWKWVTDCNIGGKSEAPHSLWPSPDPTAKRPHPDFSCFLIDRECWDRVGPFDEHCEVAFYEDNLYHVAMHRKGIAAYCLDLPFFHHGSATIKNADPVERERIQQAAAKNKEYFHSKWKCYPGTPEYEALFSSETFGVDRCLMGDDRTR